MRASSAAVLFLVLAMTAHAAEPAYLDDRSTPQALIHSLYNAINRKEYARAWDYFAMPPARDFSSYANGFATTAQVELVTGAAVSEGAAGSIYSNVPVAISATDAKGNGKIFAGCYTIRHINGSIQEPPSVPMRIERAKLKVVEDTSLIAALPASCGEPAPENDGEDLTQRVKGLFFADSDQFCDARSAVEAGLAEPERHELAFRPDGSNPDDPPQKAELFVFDCGGGAYNTSQIYYLADALGEVQRLNFAQPNFSFVYADEENAKLNSMTLSGFGVTNTLTNSGFDEKSNSIVSFTKWRGIADASSSGTWVFDQGGFVLKQYEIDATYDGEINPVTVVKDGKSIIDPK